MLIATGDSDLSHFLLNDFDELCQHFVIVVCGYVVVNVEANGTLFPIDYLVRNTRVIWIQFVSHCF